MGQRLTSELVLKLTQQVTGPAAAARKALTGVDAALAAIGKRKEAETRLNALVTANERARTKVRDLANQIMASEKVTKRQTTAYEAAVKSADAYAKKVAVAKAGLQAAERNMRTYVGATESVANAERRLAAEAAKAGDTIARETAAQARAADRRRSLAREMARAADEEAAANRRSAQALRDRRSAALAVIGAGAMRLGYAAGAQVTDSVRRAVDLDLAQRQQVAFGNISEGAQSGILRPQADRIAQKTRFTIPDIISGQTNALEGLPSVFTGDDRAKIAQAVTENAVNYALAIPGNIDMAEAVHTVIAYLKTSGKDISTPDKAAAESAKAVNMMVKAAKLSGLSANDITEFLKFGSAPGTFAGFSDPFKFAIAAAQKRAGTDGALTGTFLRSMSGYLVAPTQKGLGALSDIGINYDDYTTMKGGANANNFASGLYQRFGVQLSQSQRKRIQGVMGGTFTDDASGDELPVISNRELFLSAIQPIVEESFARKKGKVNATDSAKIKKDLDAYYNSLVGSVDVERMLLDIIKKDPSMGTLNALLGKQQGGRFIPLMQQLPYMNSDINALKELPPDFAQKIGDYLMGGLYGSQQNAEGSIETAKTKIGEAWSDKLKTMFDAIGNGADAISGMDKNARLAAGGLMALAAGAGMAAGAYTLWRGVTALGGFGAGAAAASAGAASPAGAALGGAAAGATGLGRMILKRILGPLGVGAMVGEGLSYTDPSGSLWGSTSGINDWVVKNWGFDPSKSGSDSQSFQNWLQRHVPLDTPSAMPDPFKGTNPYDDPLRKSFAPPVADGFEKQSSLVQQQARELVASIQSIFNQGVNLPVHLDSSSVAAGAAAARAAGNRAVDSMVRSTFADVEIG